jgi:hypothetical protein
MTDQSATNAPVTLSPDPTRPLLDPEDFSAENSAQTTGRTPQTQVQVFAEGSSGESGVGGTLIKVIAGAGAMFSVEPGPRPTRPPLNPVSKVMTERYDDNGVLITSGTGPSNTTYGAVSQATSALPPVADQPAGARQRPPRSPMPERSFEDNAACPVGKRSPQSRRPSQLRSSSPPAMSIELAHVPVPMCDAGVTSTRPSARPPESGKEAAGDPWKKQRSLPELPDGYRYSKYQVRVSMCRAVTHGALCFGSRHGDDRAMPSWAAIDPMRTWTRVILIAIQTQTRYPVLRSRARRRLQWGSWIPAKTHICSSTCPRVCPATRSC